MQPLDLEKIRKNKLGEEYITIEKLQKIPIIGSLFEHHFFERLKKKRIKNQNDSYNRYNKQRNNSYKLS